MKLPHWLTSAHSIAIVGFGREGQSTYRFLRKHLPGKSIRIIDQREDLDISKDGTHEELGLADAHLLNDLRHDPKVEFQTGNDAFRVLEHVDVLFKTPGIPLSALRYAPSTHITSQADLFTQLFGAQTIGVTGTKGKSTTAHVIAHVLRSSGLHTLLAGNIGVPLLDLVGDIQGDTWVVAELSAFQCETLTSPTKYAVLTSFYQDHLDYYGTLEKYRAAKHQLFAVQTAADTAVVRLDDEAGRTVVGTSSARLLPIAAAQSDGARAWIADDQIVLADTPIIPISTVQLPGKHNAINCLPAVVIANDLHVSHEQIRQGLSTVQPLPGRLESVATIHGITFYDDALATIPEATIHAIMTLGEQVETLIVGGQDRGQDFAALARAIKESSIRTLITFAPTGPKVAPLLTDAADITIKDASSMEDAVRLAYEYTQSGKAVLLSTAAPSFGLFADYQDRSRQYQQCIHSLAPTTPLPAPKR